MPLKMAVAKIPSHDHFLWKKSFYLLIEGVSRLGRLSKNVGKRTFSLFSNEGFHQNIQMVHSLKFDASVMIHCVYLCPRLPGDDMFKIFHLKTNCVFPFNLFH